MQLFICLEKTLKKMQVLRKLYIYKESECREKEEELQKGHFSRQEIF